MKLHQLRQVLAVADLGSIRAAARHLRIAQSGITKSVRQLEKELDVPLFERHKQGVLVTPMGALFLQRARAASAELARAQEEISQHRGRGTGAVTVSLSTVPHVALLPNVVKPFIARYPDVSLTVLEALGFHHRIETEMRTGVVDAYIGVAPTSKLASAYRMETLFRSERCVIARAGHSLAAASSVRQLSNAQWVVSSAASADAILLPVFRKHHYTPPDRFTFAAGILTQVVIALNSDMLMIGPRHLVEFPPYKGHLVPVPIREKVDSPAMVMITRAASPLTPAAEHFCDLIRRTSVPLRK